MPSVFRFISPLVFVINLFSYVGQLAGPLIKATRAVRSVIEVSVINIDLVLKLSDSSDQ